MKNIILKNSMISIAVSTLLLMSGCNSDSTTQEEDTQQEVSSQIEPTTSVTTSQESVEEGIVKGTVALGAGAAAHITLIGSNSNSINGESDENGYYEIDASSLTEPIMVQAVLDETGDIMYSFAEANTGIVNVTPLTTYLVDQAATALGLEGGASQLFTSFTEGSAPSQISNEVDSATEELDNVIGHVMSENNVSDFDHFSGEFDPNHDGYDAVLDELDIALYQDDVVIREGNVTLDTLNYDISTDTINILGTIKDITSNETIANASLTLVDQEGNTLETTADENGTFDIGVETMRKYTITISAPNYQTQTVPNISSFIFNDIQLNDIVMIPTDTNLTTNLSGNVIDGRTTAQPLQNVTLQFREGYSNRTGDVIATTQTNENGDFTLNELQAGVYTVEISLDGYNTQFQEIVAYGESDQEDFSLLSTFTPESNAFATITLNWDEVPADLDSHLTGPSATADERFHIYYGNQISNATNDLEIYRDAIASVTGNNYDSATEEELEDIFYNELTAEEQEEVSLLVYQALNPEEAQEQEFFLELHRSALESVTGETYPDLNDDELWEVYINLDTEDQASVDAIIEEATTQHYEEQASQLPDPCSNGELASLDRDRTDTMYGLNPETVTICKSDVTGLYKYYVTNYSGEAPMAYGNAQVTVTTTSGISRTFTAPAADDNLSSYNGNVWHVFNIDSDGNIYPVNEMIGQDNGDYDLETGIYSAPSLHKKDIRFTADKKEVFTNLPTK